MSGGLRQRIYVKIPPERLASVIGPEGSVKKEIERALGVEVSIDSENSMAVVEGKEGSSPEAVLRASEIIKAISYGFSPERAMTLLGEEQTLIYIDLKDRLGDRPNHIKRVKGRIIGEEGRARRTLEEMTGCHIHVGEAHVAIIGEYRRAMVAKEAIEMLIEGRAHSTVYRHVETLMREIRRLERPGPG